MTKPCYPWYCTECGSAINDRTNHKCLHKLKQLPQRYHRFEIWEWSGYLPSRLYIVHVRVK